MCATTDNSLLRSEQSDTPKTDALPQPYYNRADAIYELSRDNLVIWQNHARDQERAIAALTAECAHYRGRLRALANYASDSLTVSK